MSDQEQSVSDTTPTGSADQGTSSTNDNQQQLEGPDNDPWRKRVLSQLKNAKERERKVQEELELLKSKEREREEADLKKKEDFQTLLKLREEELQTKEKELSEFRQHQIRGRKLNAFLDTLKADVDKKYWGLIPTDKIVIDDASGDVDQMSVTAAVEYFRNEHPVLINQPGKNKLPQEAPGKFATSKISYDEWKNLPLEEMKKYKQEDIIT